MSVVEVWTAHRWTASSRSSTARTPSAPTVRRWPCPRRSHRLQRPRPPRSGRHHLAAPRRRVPQRDTPQRSPAHRPGTAAHGDEILVGRTTLVFRDRATPRRRATDGLAAPPANLTRMERCTLVELCRPLLAHNTFQPPASVREIADRLFIGKNAVQAHLTSLYGKFGIHDEPRPARGARQRGDATRRGHARRHRGVPRPTTGGHG